MLKMITRCIFPLFGTIICLFLTGCQSPNRNDVYADVPMANIEKGKMLAGQHCQSCHQLPDPALLDAKTWEQQTLPAMGPLLGIFNYKEQNYRYLGDPQMRGPGYLASNPLVSPEEWQYIVDYYTATAPDQLPAQDRTENIAMGLSLFQAQKPQPNYPDPHSCFVKIRQNAAAPLVVSDAVTLKTYFLNAQLMPVDSLTTGGPLTNIDFNEADEAIACNAGKLEPNDGAHGSAVQLKQGADHWEMAPTPLLDGLHRPMQVLPADFNDDGQTDYLVCEFGYMQGGLSWMENQGQETFQKHLISNLPGALKAYLRDYDEDGDTDIIAFFAQGQEGIFLFTNQGNGDFATKELLRFPALYGSSSFELADFNQDGLTDILYTAGDNADHSSVLKPYHGVYIFLNRGEDRFEQAYFFPIHGCYKAMAGDFDQDGDLDLAAIGYYADFSTQPEEGFVYLENEGGLNFSPYSSPELQVGRWITMDVGDIDQDGWLDIVLGNFVQPSSLANPAVNWAAGPPVMILKNKGREY